jgi:hypothetical protein
MKGKYDSYQDSALHYLCSSEWGNDSFGDVSTYGVYIWRISNNLQEVHTLNIEINSVLEEWEEANPELLGTLECTLEEFRKTLVGHFLVSENEQGQVTVRQFPTEGALISQFKAMEKHYIEWTDSDERAEEEAQKLGDERL